ncbi:MAG: hypothetical protein LBS00_11700 [Synergistaceae bacterium]|nr:hypothetical protein [Synergistaceae bacterium]
MRREQRVLGAIFALASLLIAPMPACAESLEINIERALELATANNNRLKIAESDVAVAEEARRQSHRANGVTVRVTPNSSYTEYQGEALCLPLPSLINGPATTKLSNMGLSTAETSSNNGYLFA